MTDYLFSCDWGTSLLRIRLVDAVTFTILDEECSNQGVARIHEQYKKYRTGDREHRRVDFYVEALRNSIDAISNRVHLDLRGVPIIISGMASSSIGMVELPYADIPFSIHGENTVVHCIEASKIVNHQMLLLSGVRAGNEVMRGEETQLVGISEIISKVEPSGESLIVLPGTHSKHVQVKNGMITQIGTYITGELFAILSQNGLIKEAVQAHTHALDPIQLKAFLMGVEDSGTTAFLQSLFQVRTNQLFGKLTKEENYSYLSGLLIGNELRTFMAKDHPKIILCCGSKLHAYYRQAMVFLGLQDSSYFIDPKEAEYATCKGQWLIAKKYLDNNE